MRAIARAPVPRARDLGSRAVRRSRSLAGRRPLARAVRVRVQPVVSGLLIGLLTNAYEPEGRGASPPTNGSSIALHPWTSKLVVPIFALANAGLHVDEPLLAAAATSPITWGIVLAYAIGKPLGIVIAACAASSGLAPR